MRFPGLFCSALLVATGGCATHPSPPVGTPTVARAHASEVSGVWDGMNQSTIRSAWAPATCASKSRNGT